MQNGIFEKQMYSSLKLSGPFIPLLGRPLSKILALDIMDDYYLRSLQSPGESFSEQILNALNVSLNFQTGDLENIPESGPAVVVANHPFGGIEGILISALLQKRRPDVKIMANYLLKAIPELSDQFIYVDPFENGNSAKQNIAAMRQAIRWVKNGGLLVVFPSGTVSHFHIKSRKIADPAWKGNIGKFIETVEAPVIPVYFEGHNNLAFQTLGLIHPLLRTVRLPYEVINKANRTFTMQIGHSTPYSKLKQYATATEKIAYLRKRTYNLGNRKSKSERSIQLEQARYEAIPEPFDAQVIQDEIDRLPVQQILFEQKEAVVFYAHKSQIPVGIQEIGRQREITFRAADEGSGKAIDLDKYDEYYIHLVAWNREHKQIIGAYRLGLSDHILREFGPKGLYITSLFKIKRAYFNSIMPAIELGRSFITKEYQRSFNSLFLLWRGIGAFITLHPQYRYLFGPVSISNAYQPLSQKMMLNYLKEQHGNPQLSKMVSAINPDNSLLKKFGVSKKDVLYLSELEDLISDLEDDFSGIPVLIRQYLKLGAKFLSFNRDEDFSSVLDGLIVVDLCKSEPRLLDKYYGKEGARFFLDYHALRDKK